MPITSDRLLLKLVPQSFADRIYTKPAFNRLGTIVTLFVPVFQSFGPVEREPPDSRQPAGREYSYVLISPNSVLVVVFLYFTFVKLTPILLLAQIGTVPPVTVMLLGTRSAVTD